MKKKKYYFYLSQSLKLKKFHLKKKYNKKIFIIELSELGNRNFVNYDNMQIENVNNIAVMNFGEKFYKNLAEKEKNN